MKTITCKSQTSVLSKLLMAFSLLIAFGKTQAQNLDYNAKETIALNDGTIVTLYAQLQGDTWDAKPSLNYYYLPTQVMLSKDPASQVPEFLFMKYITEEREDQGGVTGALMHFLMQTGFTPSQLAELQGKLNARVSGAKVKGPVDLYAAGDANTFTITSAVVNKEGGMTKSLVTSGKAPLYQGGKVAVATNLNKYGAQLMAATFEKANSITDLSVNLFYKYYLKVNGVKGRITVDYEKISQIFKQDSISARYYRKETKNEVRESQRWDEMHKFYSKLVEKQAVDVKLDEGMPNELSKKLIEMFFQFFMDKFTTPATDQPNIAPPSQAEQQNLPGKNNAYGYYLNIKKFEQSVIRKKEVFNLSYNFLLPMELSVTQNLKTFYNSVKDNKNCIATINLNDPFYKHMDIQFLVDNDAVSMFEKGEVNYVTVNVRKKRTSGNDFTNSFVLNKDDLQSKGNRRTLSYAAGDDRNPEMFQYKTQWSLRGGLLYPKEPQWQVGQMQGNELKLPVQAHKIEFEADIDKLKEFNIARAIMQVRYSKLGEEVEENISISPAKNEPIASKTIFIDRDVRGYAYRMIFYHKTEGKLALEWSPKVSGSGTESYEYAVIPEELKDKTSAVFTKAVEVAKNIITPGPDGKVTADKVLDGFKDILGAIKN